MLPCLIGLPNDMNYNDEMKRDILFNIMALFMIIGETMPSKISSMQGIFNGIELVINAMGDNIVNDIIQVQVQKCILIKEQVMNKRADLSKVI